MLLATIATRSYLPQARVLGRSFLARHPRGRMVTLVVDAPGEGLRDDEPFEVLTPDRLSLERAELRRMATMYTVTELATALKPFLLRHLVVDRGEATATYLDSDIVVYGTLDHLDELAGRYGLLLTPHRDGPLAPGVPPIEYIFGQAGSYNAGFVAVSAAAVPFLDWWAERCRRDCVVAVADGLHADQRWLDLAVTYFPHHLVRDAGCNVAYWNLDRRPLSGPGPDLSGLTAGGAPLRFFHFSGFDPDLPHMLSEYQGARPWLLLSEQPVLRALCQDYVARLEAEGRSDYRKIPYGFATTATGMPIDTIMRRLFRRELLLRESGVREDLGSVDELPDPFEPEGAAAFVELLRSPLPHSQAPRIPRYLHGLWLEHLHLQRSFPSLTAGDGNHFLWWMREMGARELGIPAELVPSEADLDPTPGAGAASEAVSAAERAQEDRGAEPEPTLPPAGVRLVGSLDAEHGEGEAGRVVAAQLDALGEKFAVVVDHETRSRQRARDYPVGGNLVEGNIDLLCVVPERLALVLDRLGPGFGVRYRVGSWSWELEDFPAELLPATRLVDEIWAASSHAAGAISRALAGDGAGAGAAPPVHVVPPAVRQHRRAERSRAELGLPDGFVFLFCFDFLAGVARKNPDAVLDAFERAFAPGAGPQLVLSSVNGPYAIAELERLRLRAADRPDVHVRDGYLDRADQQALVAACDAYVSLHRAEGFGLTLAEAMLLGKPVIATGYSGNLEFMDEENSFLVGYELAPVGPGLAPYPSESRWARPDVDEAAALMQRVVEDPPGTRAVADLGRRTIEVGHTVAARRRLVAGRLAAIRTGIAEAHAAELAARAEARAAAEAAEAAAHRPRWRRAASFVRHRVLG